MNNVGLTQSDLSSQGSAEENSEWNQKQAINQLPTEISANIFSNLGRIDLGRSRGVCYWWNSVAIEHNVHKLPDPVKDIFGEKDWKEILGDPGKVPPIPSDIEKEIERICTSFKIKSDDLMLVLIPATVNGEPYCLDLLLEKLIKNEKFNKKFQNYPLCRLEIKKAHGNKVIKESYWALMTKDVLEGSKLKSRDYLQELVEKVEHCRLPTLIEATTSIIAHYLKTEERLYNRDPWTETYCQEKVEKYGIWNTCVGGFGLSGLLYVSHIYYYGEIHVGAAVLRKFKGLGS